MKKDIIIAFSDYFDIITSSQDSWAGSRRILHIKQKATPPTTFNGIVQVINPIDQSAINYNMCHNATAGYSLDIDVTDIALYLLNEQLKSTDTTNPKTFKTWYNLQTIEIRVKTLDTTKQIFLYYKGHIEPEFIPPYPKPVDELLALITPADGQKNIILPPQRQINATKIKV